MAYNMITPQSNTGIDLHKNVFFIEDLQQVFQQPMMNRLY